MNNLIFSTRNIDQFISDVADEVVKKMELLDVNPQRPIDQTNQLLTIQDAAEFLSLTVPTIYSKVSRGELPVMKRTKRLYFSREDLTEYVRAGRKKTNVEIKADAETYLRRR